MADFEPRLISFRVLGMVIMIAGFAFALVCLIGLIQTSDARGFWGIAFAVSILGGIIGTAFYGLVRLLLAVEANTHHTTETLGRIVRHLDHVNEGIDALNENILLSEDAKAIAFRTKDLQALRQALEEEIAGRNWEAALYLADQMEKRFGYRHDAEQYRQHIQIIRERQKQDDLAQALGRFEDLLTAFDWEAAGNQIAQIQGSFSDAPEASGLGDRLAEARAARKKGLLREWDQVVQRNEVDRGIEILRELDKYLTKSEVAAFEESARGVFRAKLHNLGVQFSLLVEEQQWDRAVEVAEEIIAEFPNSRMAQEISPGLPNLRGRALGMRTSDKEEPSS
jgi:hypothetical protein